MENLEKFAERIISQVNISLREFSFDARQYIPSLISTIKLTEFYGFYGISSNHPIHFHFSNSNLAGSYFLGKCKVDNSILYKCDVRGDELKEKGDVFRFQDFEIVLEEDEAIWVKGSYLIKTLVHNFSHDPEKVDLFLIKNTVSSPYANIHGAPMDGCFLAPFSTVDLTTLRNCVIGTYSYVQVGELDHQVVEAGRIWIKAKGAFDFDYRFPPEVLDKRYIAFEPEMGAMGMFMDFAEDRKLRFQRLYDVVHLEAPMEKVPTGTSISRYAVFEGKNQIGENVLVAQRSFLENARLGKGANAQENCYISSSHLEGYNVTAHGATIIYSHLKNKVFAGFNSFLQGTSEYPLVVGEESIIMPHTIIDMKERFQIPPQHIVWGYITNEEDLKTNSIPIEKLADVNGEITIGNMRFKGSGLQFVEAFQHRIEHILEANGAFFDSETGSGRGHAQKGQNISFHIIQPYTEGPRKGIYPTIDINP